MRFCSRYFGHQTLKFRGLLPSLLRNATSLPEGGSGKRKTDKCFPPCKLQNFDEHHSNATNHFLKAFRPAFSRKGDRPFTARLGNLGGSAKGGRTGSGGGQSRDYGIGRQTLKARLLHADSSGGNK